MYLLNIFQQKSGRLTHRPTGRQLVLITCKNKVSKHLDGKTTGHDGLGPGIVFGGIYMARPPRCGDKEKTRQTGLVARLGGGFRREKQFEGGSPALVRFNHDVTALLMDQAVDDR